MSTKKQISLSEIKTLITEKGYYRYQRECKGTDDKSVQSHCDLQTWEMDEIYEHEALQGIRRNVKVRSYVLIDDINNTDATTPTTEATDEVAAPENEVATTEEVEDAPVAEEEVVEEVKSFEINF